MALFGDHDTHASSALFDDDNDPAAAPAPTRAGRTGNSILFADDDAPKPTRTTSSLFAEEDNSAGSPWALPTPKKAGRAALVSSLLATTAVPDAYTAAYDALAAKGHGDGAAVSVASVQALVAASGVANDDQARILELVLPARRASASVGRSEFHVVFALLGLAQEGEELTLDGVDERKQREPPRLGWPTRRAQR